MTVTPEKDDPELSAGYQVRRCHRRFDRLLTSYLAEHGIKTGYWYYLRVLWIKDGVTQKYLSDMTNVAENTTASILNSMAADGLVTRKRDKEDRRKFSIQLSERGRALEGKLLHVASLINSEATAGIDEAQLEICLNVLNRMAENLGATLASQAH